MKISTFLKPLSFLPALALMYMIYSFSAQTGEGTDALLSKISDLLTGRMTEYELLIPYGDAAVLDPLRHEAEMLSLEYREDGIYVRAVLDERMLGRMKQYIPGYVEPLEEWER